MQQADISRFFSDKTIWFAEKEAKAGMVSDSARQKRLIAALQAGGERPLRSSEQVRVASFGISEIDGALCFGGLKFGAIHECFFAKPEGSYFPLIVPVCLSAGSFEESSGRYFFWIGRKAWPSPFILEQAGGEAFLSRCVFLDPADEKSLLWSVETALRSRAASCVVVAIKNLRFSVSRRLELAARYGGTLGIFLRDPRGLKDNSAATTRWLIKHRPSPDLDPLFEIELLRQKGAGSAPFRWVIRFCTGKNGQKKVSLHIPSSLGGQSETEDLQRCAG